MRGYLEFMVLKTLESKQKSGVEIISTIEKNTGWKPSYGSVYPLLKKLVREKKLSSTADGKKNLYRLTKKGEKEVKTFEKKKNKILDDLIKRMKLLHELFDMDMDFDIALLKKVRKGESPFIKFHGEIQKIQKQQLRILENKLYVSKEKELRKIMNDYERRMRKL